MTCKLGITFADESKDFESYVEKSGQSSGRSSPQKAVPTRPKLLIEVFATFACVQTSPISFEIGDVCTQATLHQ